VKLTIPFLTDADVKNASVPPCAFIEWCLYSMLQEESAKFWGDVP